MAVNSDTISFDRTVTQLIHVCDRVELRKKWCTKVCLDCQQLIRPWPRRVGSTETGKTFSEEQSLQGKNTEQESSGDFLTPGELEHLRLIEEALKKAGKTRRVFQAKSEDSKVLTKTPATEAVNRSSTEAEEKLRSHSGDAPMRTFNSQAKTASESNTRLSGSLSIRERNQSLPDIGSSHAQKARYGKPNNDVRKTSDVAVISQTALDSLRTSALSRPKSSNSIISVKSSGSVSSSSVKYKPAHVTAPFLTKTQISSRNRSSGHHKSKQPSSVSTQMKVKSLQPNLKSLSAVGYRQNAVTSTCNNSSSSAVTSARNSSSSSIVTSARSISSSPADRSSSSPTLSSACNSSLSHTVTSDRDPSPARSSVTLEKKAISHPCRTEALSFPVGAVPTENVEKVVEMTRDNKQTYRKSEKDATNRKSASFNLSQDGSSLKLPSDFGKALAANHRLREKLKASFTTKPRNLREGESSSESFMLRLQKHMEDADADVFSHSQSCHRHSSLNVWLGSLFDRVMALNISEETPTSLVFQAQKIVEFVLHEFCGQEEVFRSLVPRKLPPGEPGQDIKLNIRHKDSMLHWFSLKQDDGEQLALSARISYQTPSQLQKYLTLVHEIQLVRLQRFLLEEAGHQAIKLLKQLNPNDRLFRELYRVSYSLICSLGQSFPSVVHNIEDEGAEKGENLGSSKDLDA